jgi:hypothetical protein
MKTKILRPQREKTVETEAVPEEAFALPPSPPEAPAVSGGGSLFPTRVPDDHAGDALPARRPFGDQTDRAAWEMKVIRAASENPDPVVGWLVVVKGPGRGHAVPLGHGINTIGRGEGQRPRVNFGDGCISRKDHVKVTYDGKTRRFYVSQGTSVKLAHLNGQPVLQVYPLATGDRLSLGETELAFVPFCGTEFDWDQA